MSRGDKTLMSGAARARHEVSSDECLVLLASFMRVRDRKARAEIVKLAQRCADFESGGIVSFGLGTPRD
ncbi:hypothetical protein CO675_38165 [Bradyrhizobium sp. C9]|nr:hypothetical protein CO675_38165 [Bradyrhizobium sp. C9]